MIHHPETEWNLTPRQQAAMDAFIATGTVKLAAQTMKANENTVAELLRQARARMDACSLTMAALMWDRFRRAKEPAKDDWVHARVSRDQAEKVRSLGGSRFVRAMIDDAKPARIEHFWCRPVETESYEIPVFGK